MRTIDQMVQQEILCCMSHIVSTLANGASFIETRQKTKPQTLQNFTELCEQAAELCYPIPDYEEAAIQAGFTKFANGAWGKPASTGPFTFDPEQLCREHIIEPYDREVFEHWAITDWFADRLIEQGEKVDKDFGNLCIWARTTTGQGIASDGVVERIYANRFALDELDEKHGPFGWECVPMPGGDE